MNVLSKLTFPSINDSATTVNYRFLSSCTNAATTNLLWYMKNYNKLKIFLTNPYDVILQQLEIPWPQKLPFEHKTIITTVFFSQFDGLIWDVINTNSFAVPDTLMIVILYPYILQSMVAHNEHQQHSPPGIWIIATVQIAVQVTWQWNISLP
jgi:hypothetical protein